MLVVLWFIIYGTLRLVADYAHLSYNLIDLNGVITNVHEFELNLIHRYSYIQSSYVLY